LTGFAKRTIRDVDPSGKKVLVRVDFNVPLGDGGVADDTRIRAALPTIRYLREHGAALALCSHLGRPKGQDQKLSLRPVALRLAELLGRAVPLLPDAVGPAVREAVARLRPGDVVLLENVRFHAEEEKNDPAFAKELASGYDLFVNDAFGAAHRAHASTEGVAKNLPAYAGLLLEKELLALGGLLSAPKRPFLAIIGGAKVSTKIDVLRALLARVDVLAIGGGMANTFLLATGRKIGRSLAEPDRAGEAKAILDDAKAQGKRVLLPDDVLCAPSVDEAGARAATVKGVDDVADDLAIVDIGPRTTDRYAAEIRRAKTIFWNGPLGVFEIPAFANGTKSVAELMASSRATTIVGGGESVQAVEELGLADKMTHVSTGGGASLELIEGKTLPGVAAIPDRTEVHAG
jgi:phosphoglycerate kinase